MIAVPHTAKPAVKRGSTIGNPEIFAIMSVNIFRLLSFLAALSLSGCASNISYPVQWGEGYPGLSFKSPRDQKICDLAGFYSDNGDAAPGQEGPAHVSLFGLVFPSAAPNLTNRGGVVEISGPERSHLVFNYWSGPEKTSTQTLISLPADSEGLSPDQYICMENGVVIVAAKSGGGNAIIDLAGSGSQTSLFRGKDGRIMLRVTNTSILFPWYQNVETRWYRFSPIEKKDYLR